MGFNRRKLEDQRREAAEREAAKRRASETQILEDAERLIAAWTKDRPPEYRCCSRQRSAPRLLRRYWFLWARCPACRTNAIDLRTLDRNPDAAMTSLIPWLSCRFMSTECPFAELVRLSRTSIARRNADRERAARSW